MTLQRKITTFSLIVFYIFSLSCNDSKKKSKNTSVDSIPLETINNRRLSRELLDTTNNAYTGVINSKENSADNKIKTIPLKFEANEIFKIVEDSIHGYEIHDYIFELSQGLNIQLSLKPLSGKPYFNLMEPNEEFMAIYNSSIDDDNQYAGITKKSGTYKVRVYLMRSAARRDELGKFRLKLSMAE